MIRQRFDARRTPRGFVAGALILVVAIAAGPAALAQSPSASPPPSADASPASSITPTASPFPWPTLPSSREVPVPARFEPKGRPDASTTRHGIRVDLWLSSPTAAPGEWVQAVVRTTNLHDTTAWSWSGECRTSGTRVAVDLGAIIPPGEPQTGNAAAFKRQALRWTTETGFAPRRSIDDWYASTDSGYAFVECPIMPGPLELKAGASLTERFAWYPYDSFDGEVWLQPLPPGPVTVTASWPYLSRGERPSMSSRRAYRTMKPVKATTELEVTGDGPGTPSLPELIDIALADPEFRAWVELEPGRERWCDWCVSATGWPGPTYERHLYLSHLGDTRPNGVLDLELDQRQTRGIIILDPWTGEVIDVLFLGGRGEGLDAFDVLADPQAQADRSALPASPSPGSTAATFDVFAESPTRTVSLGLYSGLPDPSWELSAKESTALTALLESLPRVDGSAPSGGLGYHGFTIERLTPEGMPRLLVAFEGTVSDPLSSHLSYLDDPERSVERFLLESGRDQLSAVEIMSPGLDPGPMPSPGSSAETQ
jgi:hypothetical protein